MKIPRRIRKKYFLFLKQFNNTKDLILVLVQFCSRTKQNSFIRESPPVKTQKNQHFHYGSLCLFQLRVMQMSAQASHSASSRISFSQSTSLFATEACHAQSETVIPSSPSTPRTTHRPTSVSDLLFLLLSPTVPSASPSPSS